MTETLALAGGGTSTHTVSHSYDGIARLIGATESPGNSYAYQYDLSGNRTQVSVNGTPITSATYDAADQVQGWTYDQASNLQSDGATTYSYDALNRLTGTSATGQSRAYAYNGDGVLVSATANGTATTYAQDLASGQSQVLASTTSSVVTDYLYGLDRLGSLSVGTWAWYGLDGQGSVRQSFDAVGDPTGSVSYDPFGLRAHAALVPPCALDKARAKILHERRV